MFKSVLSYLQISALGMFGILLFAYLMLPSLENLKGKCFYYSSQGFSRELKQGRLFFFKVDSNDILRYHVDYYEINFSKDKLITKLTKKKSGTLSYLFQRQGHEEFQCPRELGEEIKL
ncbi:hypothetical protein M901_2118 [Bacteriovorax sp. DB6_IX]|nr:hypothetical protein M901_2118 [Bacteriovorax sp. DB6_IX]